MGIFIFAAIGVIFIIKSHVNKPKYDQEYYINLEAINEFNKSIESYRKEYFTNYHRTILVNQFQDIYKYFSNRTYNKSKEPIIINFRNTFSNIDSLIRNWNEEYIREELEKNKALFDNIDGKSLDDQQRRAVVVDEMNN